jgi:hypothetical protein
MIPSSSTFVTRSGDSLMNHHLSQTKTHLWLWGPKSLSVADCSLKLPPKHRVSNYLLQTLPVVACPFFWRVWNALANTLVRSRSIEVDDIFTDKVPKYSSKQHIVGLYKVAGPNLIGMIG